MLQRKRRLGAQDTPHPLLRAAAAAAAVAAAAVAEEVSVGAAATLRPAAATAWGPRGGQRLGGWPVPAAR